MHNFAWMTRGDGASSMLTRPRRRFPATSPHGTQLLRKEKLLSTSRIGMRTLPPVQSYLVIVQGYRLREALAVANVRMQRIQTHPKCGIKFPNPETHPTQHTLKPASVNVKGSSARHNVGLFTMFRKHPFFPPYRLVTLLAFPIMMKHSLVKADNPCQAAGPLPCNAAGCVLRA